MSINGNWENWTAMSKIMNVDPYLKTKTKVNSNVRSEAIKLPEENIGEKILDIGPGSDFLD